jgi:hypothetical protein
MTPDKTFHETEKKQNTATHKLRRIRITSVIK